MKKRPKILTAAVVDYIRSELSALGFSFDGEDIGTPELFLKVLEHTDAECALIHISILDSYGRRRFLRDAKQIRDIPIIAIGSKSDLSNDGVKKYLKEGLLTAVFADGNKLIGNLERALSDAAESVSPGNMQEHPSSEAEPESSAAAPLSASVAEQVRTQTNDPEIAPVYAAKQKAVKKQPPKKQSALSQARDYKPKKPLKCTTIAVFQTLTGSGCTWAAATLAAWLADNGMKTALTGDADLVFLPPEPSPDERYSYAGVNVYCGNAAQDSEWQSGYDYVVADAGAIVSLDGDKTMLAQNRAVLNRLKDADMRVMVADTGRTRREMLKQTVRRFESVGLSFSVALVRTPAETYREVKKLVKDQPITLMPTIPDPFERTPERDAFCASLFHFRR